MATFSGREAYNAGFRLLARKPSVALYWGALYFLFIILPQWLAVLTLHPDLKAFLASPAAGDAAAMDAEILEMQARSLIWQPVQIIGTIVGASVIYTAIIRAVLEPENDRHGYVRFGKQELWVGLVSVVAFVLIMLLILALALPIGVLAGVSLAFGGGEMSPNFAALLVTLAVVAFAALVWFGQRFVFAYPMTFEDRAFRLFESWGMTRGHVGKMLLVALAILLTLLAIFIAIGVVFIILAIIAGVVFSAQMENLANHSTSEWFGGFMLLGLVGSMVWSVAVGAIYAVAYAPAADIYRQLKASAASAP